MSRVPFAKRVRLAQLHAELRSAVGSRLVTVRGSGDGGDGCSTSGEVVGDVTEAEISPIIAAHVPRDTPEAALAKPAVDALLSRLDAGTATDADRNAGLAKVIRFLLRTLTALLLVSTMSCASFTVSYEHPEHGKLVVEVDGREYIPRDVTPEEKEKIEKAVPRKVRGKAKETKR